MTKKDFQLIADAVASVEGFTDAVDKDGVASSALRLVVDALSGSIAATHPRFDAAKFEKACLPLQSERQKQAILRALEQSQ